MLCVVALIAAPGTILRAQTLADLRYVRTSPPALDPPVSALTFIAERPEAERCQKKLSAPLLVSESTTDTAAQISARLASTPIFVKTYSGKPATCELKPRDNQLVAQSASIADFCQSNGRIAMSSLPCNTPGGIANYRTWDSVLRMPRIEVNRVIRTERQAGKYQWKPALLQSLNFLLFEHAFRLLDDPYLRYLMLHKPFWHDWAVSAGQFDMSRWGDGDDFLVNYIGHPMQGGVTGNIYIQNDPKARALKFGKSRAYWNSRLRAMLWSAAYSTYFEIGPGLSEVAVGNEGGYTYTPGCGHYICDRPGYKPPTNNTGWVDFIVTPTMGTGLMVLEDAIEAKIVDPIAKGDHRFKFLAMRSILTPTHSMANLMAGRVPWFRYSDEETGENAESKFLPGGPAFQRNQAWKNERRWNAGIHYTNIDLPMDWPGCSACRVHSSGVGATFGYRLTNLLWFDSELNVFPGANSSNGKSRAEEFLAGLKIGRTIGSSWGLFTTFRPGVIHYDKTLVPGSQTQYENASRFALDVGGAVEYYASPRSTIRFDIGTTFVRYLTGHPDPRQLPDTVLSPNYIVTQGNFHLGSGYVFRF